MVQPDSCSSDVFNLRAKASKRASFSRQKHRANGACSKTDFQIPRVCFPVGRKKGENEFCFRKRLIICSAVMSNSLSYQFLTLIFLFVAFIFQWLYVVFVNSSSSYPSHCWTLISVLKKWSFPLNTKDFSFPPPSCHSIVLFHFLFE